MLSTFYFDTWITFKSLVHNKNIVGTCIMSGYITFQDDLTFKCNAKKTHVVEN